MLVNNFLKLIAYSIVIANFYGNSCNHYDSPVIHRKMKIYEANCKNNAFQFDYYYSTKTQNAEFHNNIFLDEKGVYFRLHEKEKIYIDKNSDYIKVSSLTSGEESIQVKIYCKANGQLILDTGIVTKEKAECFENNTWFYFLDGHAKKKEGDSCFPKGLNVEGLKEIMKSNN